MTPADLKAENAALTLQLARFAAAIERLEAEPDLKAENARLKEELDIAEWALRNNGYRKQCDIAACNCGPRWHHGGHANERLREIDDALPYANGKTILMRVRDLVQQAEQLQQALDTQKGQP